MVTMAGIGLSLGFWLGMYLFGRALPEGRARDFVVFVPSCIILLQGLRRHDRLSRRGRLALGGALAYMLSPVQLIPNVIPILGQADDVVVFMLALRYACRTIPRSEVLDLWPAAPAGLHRMLGSESLTAPGPAAGIEPGSGARLPHDDARSPVDAGLRE